MYRRLLVCVLVAGVCACGQPSTSRSRQNLVFLTREGCPDSQQLRSNLDAALVALHVSPDYQVFNVASLPATDARGAYPTPTVLYQNRDLFGVPEPPLPHQPAT